jgi:hypothetical protein
LHSKTLIKSKGFWEKLVSEKMSLHLITLKEDYSSQIWSDEILLSLPLFWENIYSELFYMIPHSPPATLESRTSWNIIQSYVKPIFLTPVTSNVSEKMSLHLITLKEDYSSQIWSDG